MLVLCQQVAIEAIWSKTFVKVGLLSRLYNFIQAEQACRVNSFVHHLFICQLLDDCPVLHVFRSSIDLFKVLCDDLLYLLAILEDFRVLSFHLPSDPCHDWMAPFDPEDLVCHLVKLLQLAFPQQLA